MSTNAPEKLRQIISDIDAHGGAELTRLTVLKKWFEHDERLRSFAIWVARQAASRGGKTKDEAATLFADARRLIKGASGARPEIAVVAAQRLLDGLRNYQNDYKRQSWCFVRLVKNWDLLLIEQALDIVLGHSPTPSDGYRLAADYCQHADARTGYGLSAASTTKISEVRRFMLRQEASEGAPQRAARAPKKTTPRKAKRRL